MAAEGQSKKVDSWVSYRPEVRVLDCTIRDGGLMNDHQFDDAFVKAVYETCVAAGVHYMELGYKNAPRFFPKSEFGPWKHCAEEDLRRVVGDNPTDLKLSAMADAERSDYKTDILPRSESVLDMIRVATYIHQIPVAVDMINDAHEKGYETTVNIMAASTVHDREMEDALKVLAESPVDVVYVVDSFGSLYSEQVRDQTKDFLKVLAGTGKQVGIHAHNNQQLAYSNTIEALIAGASYLDATINGLGRGAGNCHLELLLGFLKNPKFRVRPVLECISAHLAPLKKTVDWGYSIPYMITGQLNQHPRAAIEMLAGDAPEDIVAFYDEMFEEE
jgi:4-hydroxy 2-oxovalerate aldolase